MFFFVDKIVIGFINFFFCRKKCMINKFFLIVGLRLFFLVKILRGELIRRINKFFSLVLFSCFVKVNLNWIIYFFFRSICCLLENLLLKFV